MTTPQQLPMPPEQPIRRRVELHLRHVAPDYPQRRGIGQHHQQPPIGSAQLRGQHVRHGGHGIERHHSGPPGALIFCIVLPVM